jgi:membrane protein DedA with SNARE-associated domain
LPVYLRSAFPLTLGALRTPWRRWLVLDAAAAPLFVGLGYGLGRHVLRVDDLPTAVRDISTVGNGILFAFSLLFAYGTYRFVRTVWREASAEG